MFACDIACCKKKKIPDENTVKNEIRNAVKNKCLLYLILKVLINIPRVLLATNQNI